MVTVEFTEEEFRVFSDVMIPLSTSMNCLRYLKTLPKKDQDLFLDSLGKLAEHDSVLDEMEV